MEMTLKKLAFVQIPGISKQFATQLPKQAWFLHLQQFFISAACISPCN